MTQPIQAVQIYYEHPFGAEREVSTINKCLFFCSNNEVASFYKLNKSYIDDLKNWLKGNENNAR